MRCMEAPKTEGGEKLQAAQYINHLHGTDAEGYTGFLRLFSDGRSPVAECPRVSQALTKAHELAGQADSFMTPNTFYRPTRRTDAVRQLQALFTDLDLPAGYTAEGALVELTLMVDRGDIPRPTMAVNSGRGIHLYWKIRHAPKQALPTWQELQDMLYHRLKHLGADPRATDAARVLRLPDTINSRNGERCSILSAENTAYDMRELREQYLRPKQHRPKAKPKSAGKVSYLYNVYTLHTERAADLQRLVRMRSGEVTGHRNQLLYMYAYWRGVTMRDPETLLDVVQAFNRTFTQPEKAPAVQAVVRGTWKAVQRFIEYEQTRNTGDTVKRPTGGYWLTNDSIIKTLDITPEEQRYMTQGKYDLKTIIGKAEKYRRKNEARNAKRRNAEGRTPQEQRTHDLQEKITALRAQGLTVAQIAAQVGVTAKGVQYHLYKKN